MSGKKQKLGKNKNWGKTKSDIKQKLRKNKSWGKLILGKNKSREKTRIGEVCKVGTFFGGV